MPDPIDEVDGCEEIDMADPRFITQDGEETDALVMFADVWDDPEEVNQRIAELNEWAAAVRGDDA